MEEEMRTFRIELKSVKNNQMEIPKLKTTLSEIKKIKIKK